MKTNSSFAPVFIFASVLRQIEEPITEAIIEQINSSINKIMEEKLEERIFNQLVDRNFSDTFFVALNDVDYQII